MTVPTVRAEEKHEMTGVLIDNMCGDKKKDEAQKREIQGIVKQVVNELEVKNQMATSSD